MIKKILILLIAVVSLLTTAELGRAADKITVVFAAASLNNALTEINQEYKKSGGSEFVFSFAASSTLAKQIENGAPADIFISADEDWMNYLESKKLIVTKTRIDLLSNRLVIIAPLNADVSVNLADPKSLLRALGNGRLATGDPSHVPVGKYAKVALQKMGIWPDLEKKIAPASDTRAALALVEREEAPLGIVYSTDAAISKNVKIVGEFPQKISPKIIYPAALLPEHKQQAETFLRYLQSRDAAEIFRKHGFTTFESKN
jgi:molybdate transport system substrate-binding protein